MEPRNSAAASRPTPCRTCSSATSRRPTARRRGRSSSGSSSSAPVSGNDVARRCTGCAPDARIDAVEIDPVIQKLGANDHPDQPFQDPRVHVTSTTAELPPRGAAGNVRPRRLRAHRLAGAAVRLLEPAAGELPVHAGVVPGRAPRAEADRRLRGLQLLPPGVDRGPHPRPAAHRVRRRRPGRHDDVVHTAARRRSSSTRRATDEFTRFFAGRPEVVEPLRAAVGEGRSTVRYWYPWLTGVDTNTKARFSATPPAEPPPTCLRAKKFHDRTGRRNRPSWWPADREGRGDRRDAAGDRRLAVPLHPRAAVPGLTCAAWSLMLVLSWSSGSRSAAPRRWHPRAGAKPDWGMMAPQLLPRRRVHAGRDEGRRADGAPVRRDVDGEHGGVRRDPGDGLAGNLYAGKVNPKRLEPYYIGLFIALAVGLAVSPGRVPGYGPDGADHRGVCCMVFAPIAFAGVIFATSFKRTTQPDRVFGANVAGALVGGLAENSSVILGFQFLCASRSGFICCRRRSGTGEGARSARQRQERIMPSERRGLGGCP